ncbi:glycerol-3-phosphate 1-O-acyltransferase PlsY [Fundicoccus culcitae]|uniref:Glycerol-3-phosphate acyltransferase n=1 Tax=Fundicoccus culcitae TaxID=2969821 RepID=A0ABY5P6R8_9LACT|nr:glycerol-3-phosphate 1-O-acyltransferase PlsY [Fundicoccus culcitae]UUX34433.1 glycerol-3-phosphate 1-O-acyltransferase PlsY [Fundicoccus culcitae]
MQSNLSIFTQLLWIAIGYLSGSIPTGVLYSKIFHKVDVRQLGSGNSGATNIGRNFGFKAAVIVSVIDILKGWIPILMVRQIFPNEHLLIMLVGIASVLGHAYPIFAGFKGGKIVSTSFGVLVGFNFWIGLMTALVLFAFIYLTSTISLSALSSYTLGALYILVTNDQIVYGIGFLLITLFMYYRHRANIQRILNGTESRISWGLHNPNK